MALPMVQLLLLIIFGSIAKKNQLELYGCHLTTTIGLTWTPIKPVTVQFNVGRTKAAQVVWKEFPLRLAAAKTTHRSQGDTETMALNFSTKQAMPHIYYAGLSRVITLEGLFDLTENKITVSSDVKDKKQQLLTQGTLDLSILPKIVHSKQSPFKIGFLNPRSLP